MALAARAPHNFPSMEGQEPSWDATIVPVLRQRLQNESQMLSKRLSTHSMSGPSDDQSTTAKSTSARNGRVLQSSTHGSATAHGAIEASNRQTSTNGTGGSNSKISSSIPRKSSERQNSISQQPSNPSMTKTRTRTNSTPFSSRPPTTTGGSTGLAPGGRQSRIPKAARTIGGSASTSSHGGNASISTTTSGFHPYRPSGVMANGASNGSLNSKGRRGTVDQNYMEPPSPSFMEGGAGSEGQLSNSSSLRVPRWNNGSGTGVNNTLKDEEPPFPHSASTSTEFHYEQTRLMHAASSLGPRGARMATMDEPRPSNDSGDRPYEHWYRGEAARNGGVGELRIGRKEMLDIAHFGHVSTNPQRSSPLAYSTTANGVRRRAGSFDAGVGSGRESLDNKRESWIMDEDAAGFGKVIDETPLTDLDADEYTTDGAGYASTGPTDAAAYKTLYEKVGLGIAGSHQDEAMEDAYGGGDGDASMTYSTTPKASSPLAARAHATAQQRSQIPTSAQATAAGKTPLGNNNGASGAKSALLSKPGGPTKPNKANAAAAKGKGPKGKSKTGGKDDLGSDEMVMDQENGPSIPLEKIPYKRPPAKGNWDDIVLPAIAKKMGVEGYALRNEGGTIESIDEEARKRMSMIQPPVPGLFGYDSSKYKASRPEEDIDMGQLAVVTEPTPPETPNPVSANVTPPETIGGRDSPLAFSHYQQNLKPLDEKSVRKKAPQPAMVVSPPITKETKGKMQKAKPKDDEHAGCCAGCVVM